MKIAAIKLFCCASLLLVFVSACKKSDNTNNESSSFNWTWNGVNYTGIFKEAYRQSRGQHPVIIGGLNPTAYSADSGPTIAFNSLNIGSYPFETASNNSLYFITPNGDQLMAIAGTLKITRNGDNKLSGNFDATLTNGVAISTLNGTFTNITINQ